MYENFTNMYKLSKTLRFGLKPQGATLRYMEERGVLEEDEARAEAKKQVQSLADRYHKDFIDKTLKPVHLEGVDAFETAYTSKDPDSGEALRAAATDLINQISAAFHKDKAFGSMFSGKLFSKILPDFYKDDEEALETLSIFDGFTTYFSGYNSNREYIYDASGGSGTIGKRLISDNLPTFIDNNRKLTRIKETIPEDISVAESELDVLLDGRSVGYFFSTDNYDTFLTQDGIDRYNQVIGGYSKEDGTKIRGLNEYINLYNQKVSDRNDRLPMLTQLKKMILSEKTSLSFRPEPFTEDNEVLGAIRTFDSEFKNAEESLARTVIGLCGYDTSGIYIQYKDLRDISNSVFDSWRYIDGLLSDKYDRESNASEKQKSTKTYIKKKKAFFNKKNLYFSVADLDALPGIDGKISEYLTGAAGFHKLTIDSARKDMLKCSSERSDSDRALKRDSHAKAALKAYLDAVTDFRRFISSFMVKTADKDDVFYSDLEPGYRILSEITPLYNKTRNYLSGKLYTDEKIKLNFGSAVLLGGWSESTESTKRGTILIKDGHYYLGIIAKGQGDLFAKIPDATTDDVYQKMRYNQISVPSRDMPHVVFSDAGIEFFKPGSDILDIYKRKTFLKGESKKPSKNFNLEDCHTMIDFYKECLTKYPTWKILDLNLKETSEYDGINPFYNDVARDAYSIKFRNVDKAVVDKLVEDGRLYLFEIWHKDFSEHSHGKPDLSTIYWRALFDPRNLDNLVYKLNGGAEIFYRKSSIKEHDIIRHKKGDVVMAKNPKTPKQSKVLKYDIIKDRRFTVDHFQLNVPITINAAAPDFAFMNTEARMAIHKADSPHVIGVSRGENSLLYVTVIDPEGKVIEKRSLNIIGNTDYADLLARREAERNAERRSWETVTGIKQMKEGYLSQVVRILADLMLKYDAVLAIEDLSSNFKQSRQKIEKAVYQQFEEKLIKKLNYLVNKDASDDEAGSLYRAYQLAGDAPAFDRKTGFGKQTGFVFYVSPWNTTAIDSNTGFMNLFDTRYQSVAASRNFWHSFDNIAYDEIQDAYRFDFDYSYFVSPDRQDMLKGTKTNWSVYAKGERILTTKTDKGIKHEVVNVEDKISELFDKYSIGHGDSIKADICAVQDKAFHEELMKLFGLTVGMRCGSSVNSPVLGHNGVFFSASSDENGAYNIARKGLMIIERLRNASDEEVTARGKDGVSLTISANDWLKYTQK